MRWKRDDFSGAKNGGFLWRDYRKKNKKIGKWDGKMDDFSGAITKKKNGKCYWKNGEFTCCNYGCNNWEKIYKRVGGTKENVIEKTGQFFCWEYGKNEWENSSTKNYRKNEEGDWKMEDKTVAINVNKTANTIRKLRLKFQIKF